MQAGSPRKTPAFKCAFPLFLLGFGHASTGLAQSLGAFTPTGNLSVPREFHTATLLPNGQVLIAGGFYSWNGQFSTWASAEIYDPSNGNFTATGGMNAARQMHTATLLPNGAVLVAGGCSQDGARQASAELYDPAIATFNPTDGMSTPRCLHTATLLPNGKVLIAGGSDSVTAELYDPSTGTFAPTGDMTEPGYVDTATLLPNGKVLITRSVQDYREDHAELYDPATGTFARTGDLVDYSTAGQYPAAIPGQRPVATLLASGKVLIAGGSWGDAGGSTIAEIYDPATGAFSATGQMTEGIDAYAAAALLPDGTVLIAGRYDGGACSLTPIGLPVTTTCPGVAELYDPAAGVFGSPIESQSMEGHAATLLPDGTVLLSGGFRCCGITIDSAEIYHPSLLLPPP